MRIIGKESRDYYDTAGWADQSILFSRQPYDRALAEKNYWELPVEFAAPHDAPYEEGGTIRVSFSILCVAGEAFPVARKGVYDNEKPYVVGRLMSPAEYIYDADEVEDLIRKMSSTRRGRAGRYSSSSLWWQKSPSVADFMNIPKDALSGWCLENEAATAILTRARPPHYKDLHKFAHGMINCDGLGDRQLYKALDPATAHMRVEGYLSGVLGTREETVEISDKSRIAKAGFDKTSFRTPAGTRKPRSARRA